MERTGNCELADIFGSIKENFSKPGRGNVLKIYFPINKKFLPRRFQTARAKILKTAREAKIVPKKKQQNSIREKKMSLPKKKNTL